MFLDDHQPNSSKMIAEDNCWAWLPWKKPAKNWLLKIAVEDGCWRVEVVCVVSTVAVCNPMSLRTKALWWDALWWKRFLEQTPSGVKGIWCKTVWRLSYLVQISGVLAFCCRSRLVRNAFGERVLWFGLFRSFGVKSRLQKKGVTTGEAKQVYQWQYP